MAKTADTRDATQREALLKKTRKELLKVIFNRRGLDRLRNITDAQWRDAERQDANE